MAQLLFICLAGAVGTGARYGVGLLAARFLGTALPYGTFFVNVVGSFLISVVLVLAVSTPHVSPGLRMTLTTGFMGGLTTYSAFNSEVLRYFDERAWGLGVAYLLATVLSCLGAGALGLVLTRRLVGA